MSDSFWRYDEFVDSLNIPQIIEFMRDGKFHLKQSYGGSPAKTLRCKECSGTLFYVGQIDYITAIKCGACGWEMIVHDG